MSVVTGVMTQGRRFYAAESHPNYFQWVTKYKVFHSNDGLTFSPVFNINGDQVSKNSSIFKIVVVIYMYMYIHTTYLNVTIFIRMLCIMLNHVLDHLYI